MKKTDILNHVLQSPVNGIVFKTDRGGFRTRIRVGADPVTKQPILETHTLKGISEEIKKVFFQSYDSRKTAKHSSSSSSSRRAPQSAGVYNAKEKLQKKKKSFRTFMSAKYTGMATGSRVHRELHAYTSIMNYAAYGNHNSEQRLRAFHDSLSLNNNSGGVHPCTRAVLEFMFKSAKWVPVAAEWCVGDVKHQLKHATQIDVLAAQIEPNGTGLVTQKIILCELKTGYNDGSFFRGSGIMSYVYPPVPDAPINQAKLQLVMSAVMFCDTYNLRWSDVELYVIHCPSDVSKPIEATGYRVTEAEREAFVTALKERELL